MKLLLFFLILTSAGLSSCHKKADAENIATCSECGCALGSSCGCTLEGGCKCAEGDVDCKNCKGCHGK